MAEDTTYEYWPQHSERNRSAKLRSTQEQLISVARGVIEGQLQLEGMSPELQQIITKFIKDGRHL